MRASASHEQHSMVSGTSSGVKKRASWCGASESTNKPLATVAAKRKCDSMCGCGSAVPRRWRRRASGDFGPTMAAATGASSARPLGSRDGQSV
jgi:hypothetical protein